VVDPGRGGAHRQTGELKVVMLSHRTVSRDSSIQCEQTTAFPEPWRVFADHTEPEIRKTRLPPNSFIGIVETAEDPGRHCEPKIVRRLFGVYPSIQAIKKSN
jgi:hypothetical protein